MTATPTIRFRRLDPGSNPLWITLYEVYADGESVGVVGTRETTSTRTVGRRGTVVSRTRCVRWFFGDTCYDVNHRLKRTTRRSAATRLLSRRFDPATIDAALATARDYRKGEPA